MATLHGLLAMFFFAAASTKLSGPFDLLSLMMICPADMTPDVVRAVGWIECGLATAVAPPQVRDWRARGPAGHPLASGNAGLMPVYSAHREFGLLTTDLLLLLISAAILAGRRRPRPRSEPG